MIVSENFVSSSYLKRYLKLIKNGLFIVKKWGIQVIISMIMPTRFSERIFNPMRYAGIINTYSLEAMYTAVITSGGVRFTCIP